MLQNILLRITGKPAKESLNERCLSYARVHGLPQSLIDTLDECAYSGPIWIGPLSLSRLAELDRENGEEENLACLQHGLLIVGSGLNGDPVALELASGKMVFISHDLLWEGTYENFEECVVRTPLTFNDFWVQANESPEFPRDSYDAEQKWNQKLAPDGATG